MAFTAYSLKARVAPATLTVIIPIIVFNHFFISEELAGFIGSALKVKIFSDLTVWAVCLYYLSEAGRFLGKHVFERIYFKEESNMPTTVLLMFRDKTYSDDYKQKAHQKILKDFKIKLSNKEEEKKDPELARTKIVETMALIRKKLHTNKFLLQHNTEYGAMRNALGGAILGVSFSVFNIIFFQKYNQEATAVTISFITLIVYLLLILLSKVLLGFYGRNYAKILFREYMG